MANNKVLELIGKGKTLLALEILGDLSLLKRFKELQIQKRRGLIGSEKEEELHNQIVYEAAKKAQ